MPSVARVLKSDCGGHELNFGFIDIQQLLGLVAKEPVFRLVLSCVKHGLWRQKAFGLAEFKLGGKITCV